MAVIFAGLMLGFCGQALAQAGIDTGSITGTVNDPTGALVVGANCTLTNTATGVTQKSTTTSAGAYTFPIVQVVLLCYKVDTSRLVGLAADIVA